MYGFVKYRPTKERLYVQWMGNVSYDMWRAEETGDVSIVYKKCCVFQDLCQNFGISVKSALRNHLAIAFYQPHCDKT